MAFVDPFVPLREWRSALFCGDNKGIDGFQEGIDSTLPENWVRDSAFELTRPHPDRIRCYLFDQTGDAAVRVWLQRVTRTRVRGGPIQVIRHPPMASSGRVGDLVAHFATECVRKAAGAAGIRRTQPAFGPRSAVSSTAELMLMRLADTADGEWPLSSRADGLWDNLVSTCLAEGVAIDQDELRQWGEDSGWNKDDSAALSDLFFKDSERLAKQLAVLNQ